MENNDIKKALECLQDEDNIFCNTKCPYYDYLCKTYHCERAVGRDALALINKQETEYNELYELLQTYKADSESYRSYSKTLEKENESLKTLLNESYDTQNSLTEENESIKRRMQHLCQSKFIASFDEVDRKTKEYKRNIAEADILIEVKEQYEIENIALSAEIEWLTNENKRLRAEKEHNAGNEKYILSTVMVAPIDYTVRKMQTLIEEKADSCDICLINSNKPIDIIYQISKKQLDQIAKEMLEGDNEN